MVGISPSYFLDEMSQDEAYEVIKGYNEKVKISWEQTRMQCFYSLISFNGTKHIKKPQDLFPFTWENITKDKGKRLTRDEFLNVANTIKHGK